MKLYTKICFAAAISVVMVGGDFDMSAPVSFHLFNDAEAVVGAPATPGSVAGVKRRTRRRTAAVTAAAVSKPVVVAPAPVVVVPAPVIVTPAPPPAQK